ncbi:MAG: 16S rRNA (cytidine(1402)-2'-O)-methyltransferase [Candidatus Marinimicrobia bacterium]|nr:16S rRNA (cytidine(1402)-2'-O)-methyltransferase [Candidatus Neomarinimicrobiota bacterium]
MPGTLYVVSTPIGNLKDITQRALEILSQVDLIAAEDTRHTGILLRRHHLNKAQVSYHEHNEQSRSQELLAALQSGKDIALVSDAGTPAISDPGYRIVKLAADRGIPVVPIPGASALLAALVTSGLPTDRFLFEGFLPRKKGRRTRLESLAGFEGTVVIYEAARRVKQTLNDIAGHFGNRRVALCRELTKKFETVLRGSVQDVLETLGERPLKGECVLVIGKAGLA